MYGGNANSIIKSIFFQPQSNSVNFDLFPPDDFYPDEVRVLL